MPLTSLVKRRLYIALAVSAAVMIAASHGTAYWHGKETERGKWQVAQARLERENARLRVEAARNLALAQSAATTARETALETIRSAPDAQEWLTTPVPDSVSNAIWP